MHAHTHTHIYTNLLPTSIYGDKEKEKKQKTHQNSEITIYLESLPGKKVKGYPGEKKRKGQPCHTNWKNQEICNPLVQKQKTTAKCCDATITKSAQY